MTSAAAEKTNRMRSVEVLLFSMQMNHFGIPVQQIDQILESDPRAQKTDLQEPVLKADDVLHLADADDFLFPSWLKLKPMAESSVSSAILMIDGLSGIVEIRTGRIRRMPRLISGHISHPWIWGAALPEEGGKDLILLLDFNASAQPNRVSVK